MKVLQVVSENAVTLAEVSNLIASDQAFSVEVLTVANSPLFTFYSPITSIQQGLAILGIDRLKGIATTVGVRSYFGTALDNPAFVPLWRHSLACAFLAEIYAGQTSVMDRGAAYTTGLMHDIGRVVLAVTEPAEYAKFLESGQESAAQSLTRERELFGLDHCEIGQRLIIEWKLPYQFVGVVSHHHTDSEWVPDGQMLDAVRFGCRMASTLGFAVVPSLPSSYEQLLGRLPKHKADLFPNQAEELARLIGTKISSIEPNLAG